MTETPQELSFVYGYDLEAMKQTVGFDPSPPPELIAMHITVWESMFQSPQPWFDAQVTRGPAAEGELGEFQTGRCTFIGTEGTARYDVEELTEEAVTLRRTTWEPVED